MVQSAEPTQSASTGEDSGESQEPETDKPVSHWSKTTKPEVLQVNQKYLFSNDGGNTDGRKLSSGRHLSESDNDADLARLVGLWGAEKQYFVYGTFPDVSTSGSWSDVGHYTQLVWGATQQVGCGIANGKGDMYLVCQYYPSGNWDGEPVY